LGRSAVWTSDLKGRWATQWVTWEDFEKFTAQTVGWLLPPDKPEGFDASISLEDRGAVINLQVSDQGEPVNDLTVAAALTGPDMQSSKLELQQVGPGQYQVVTRTDQPGTYMITLTATGALTGNTTLGMVVPYSPEYRAGDINRGLLDELARITGGGPLEGPVQAFLHNLPSAASAREIGRTLLLIVALLFPIDVALRRVIFSRRDVQTAATWVSNRLPGRRDKKARPEGPVLLGNLFDARERARRRTSQTEKSAAPESQRGMERPASQQAAPPSESPPSTPPADSPETPKPGEEDSFARLREAKKRARKSKD
jgi:hypothetical protein